MRVPSVVSLLFIALGVLAACAHRAPISTAPLPQTSLGAVDAFGPGVVAVSRDADAVLVDLTTPAYLMVVRVFPGEYAEVAYPTAAPGIRFRVATARFASGTHRVAVYVEQTQVWTGSPVEGHWALGSQPPPVIAPRATGRRFRNCADTDEWAYRVGPLRSVPVLRVRQPCTQSSWQSGRWVRSVPVQVGEHYLVVIAAEAAFDLAAVMTQLDDLDVSLASGDATARAVPAYLMGEGGRWGAWIVHLP